MSDIVPVVKGRKVTDEDVARFLNNYISVYFSTPDAYKKETLGDHLTTVLTKLIPEPICEYLFKG